MSLNDYNKRLRKIFAYIESNIDNEITLDKLASISNFSKFHFSRVFSVLVDETPFEFIQRIRIERAAILLKLQNSQVAHIALECGFEDKAVFSRTFKKHFNYSPTEWRKCNSKNSNKSQHTPEPALYFCSTTKNHNKMEQLIFSEVKSLPTITVAYIRHTGAYLKMGTIYEELIKKLFVWADKAGLKDKSVLKPLIIHHDDPTVTREEKQRTSVCITIPTDTKITDQVGKMELPSGKHLVARFVLSPFEIEKAWSWIYGTWFLQNGYQPGDTEPYQLYPVMPENGKLTIEFCVPVKPGW